MNHHRAFANGSVLKHLDTICFFALCLIVLRASLVAQLLKNPPAMQQTCLGSIPEEGKGYPLKYSGLENSMDCIVHGVAKSQTRLSDFHFHFIYCASHILCSCFFTSWRFWVTCVKQPYRCYLSNSTYSFYVSLSHFGNSHQISNFFIIIIFAIVII